MLRLALIAIAAAMLLAAPASAAPVTGETLDPADGAGSAAQDVERARLSFEPATGELVLELRLRAPASPAADGWAAVHGVLYAADPARPGVCPSDGVSSELGRLESSTDPARGDVAFGPDARGSKTTSADGRDVTMAVTAQALAGREPVCLHLTLSRNRPLDAVMVPLGPGVAPPPGGGPAGPVLQPPVIVAASRRPLRVSRAGRATLLLRGFRTPVDLSARGVRRPGGPALIRGAATVERNTPVALRLALTRAGRRALARATSFRIRLTVRAVAAGAPPAVRTFRVIMRRR